jgi:hypothetical protein
MAEATLKSLHAHLRLLENASEMKRKMPTSSNQRSLKEGLAEMSRLVGLDSDGFKDPENIAAVIGAQRFVMIGGEPSIPAHVARIFDSSKVLLTMLIDPGHFERMATAQSAGNSGSPKHPNGAKPTWSHSTSLPPNTQSDQELPLENLKALLAGNTLLTCRLFRVLFEHMLGFASPSTAQQGSAALVNELTSSKEHGRSFLATVIFILGPEIDRENLKAFMLEQGLFGMHIFEHLFQNREYCEAYYTFRRLEKAFLSPAAEEEKSLRARIDRFNEQLGGRCCEAKIFETDDCDKARVDAHLAAVDLVEAMALTPWSTSLQAAVALTSSNSVRCMKTVATHFERFARGEATKEQANREIADHLLAFARQFSADSKAVPVPEELAVCAS